MLFEKSNKSRFIIEIRKRIGKMFSKLELSPNQWTILSLVFSLTAAFFLFQQKYLISALLIIVSGVIDLIDGAVAREKVAGIAWLSGMHTDFECLPGNGFMTHVSSFLCKPKDFGIAILFRCFVPLFFAIKITPYNNSINIQY